VPKEKALARRLRENGKSSLEGSNEERPIKTNNRIEKRIITSKICRNKVTFAQS